MEVEGPKGPKGPKGFHGSRREKEKVKVRENEVLLRHLLTHFKRGSPSPQGDMHVYNRRLLLFPLAYMHLP